jgi:hypothetical protein
MSWSVSLSLLIICQTSQCGFCFQRSNNKTAAHENSTPEIKSGGFCDTTPSISSKKAAAMTNIAAIMRADAL